MINGKRLDQIVASDLEILRSVQEGKTIEYKLDLPKKTDKDKKEFLADISSFANTSGGQLYFGILSKKGLPQLIDGIEISDPDAEILRLEGIILAGITPRINLHMRSIKISEGKYVIAVNINRSWIPPHQVIFGGHNKFYARNSGGKYQLDINELRAAFTNSHKEKDIHAFHVERISKILADDTPVPISKIPRAIVHVIPFESQIPNQSVSWLPYAQNARTAFRSMNLSFYRQNFEGIVLHNLEDTTQENHRYLQLFRNGILEFNFSINASSEELFITVERLETTLIRCLLDAFATLQSLGISTPIAIYLTLINVKGYHISSTDLFRGSACLTDIDREVLPLPVYLMEEGYELPGRILKPILDIIWNACNYSESPNFNDNFQHRLVNEPH